VRVARLDQWGVPKSSVDTNSHAIVAVVLPKVQHRVALSAQGAGDLTVAALVVGDLFYPPGAIVLRCRETSRAAVPKTTVDEYRQ